jgi:hypothetical protein
LPEYSTASAQQWRAPVSCNGTHPVDLTMPAVAEPAIAERSKVPLAELLRGYIRANRALNAEHPAITAACDPVIDAFRSAQESIDRFHQFVSIGSASAARRALDEVVRRHAEDGPEDRRARLDWAKPWLVWLVIAASAAYDTVFIGHIFQAAIDARDGSWQFYASYLPGLGIFAGLLCAGTMLAQNVLRHRSRRERRPIRDRLNPVRALRRLWIWRETPAQLRRDDLPWPVWPMSIVVTSLVLGVLLLWALKRARDAAVLNPELDRYAPHLAALLLMLSVAAIVMKILAHNPYADRAEAAHAGIQQVKREAEGYATECAVRVAEHGRAWNRLNAAMARAKGSARSYLEEARARVLDEMGDEADAHTLTELERTLIEETVDGQPPTFNTEVLEYGERLAQTCSPERLEEALDDVRRSLEEQLAEPDAQPDADRLDQDPDGHADPDDKRDGPDSSGSA